MKFSKPSTPLHLNAQRRIDEAPRKSRTGIDTNDLDHLREGWNFPEGSQAQNIFELDHIHSFRDLSPPVVPDKYEEGLVLVQEGMEILEELWVVTI